MTIQLAEIDSGKTVFWGDETVGEVARVDQETVYVAPQTGLSGLLRSKLGWSVSEDGMDTYPLALHAVGSVSDDGVYLKDDY
ncbi:MULTISPECIES: PRC-barrel domain containing protein [unclassified Haladaptatus]|uniref:PRC-barrel domain containing protein n=1 Tax=unclassified Haladaptatus TaxID=2622732 RepID=UPI0023E868FD|nr:MULTISPECIES: PRC-barrel domain containing protein [unclassified Haladaptatus]